MFGRQVTIKLKPNSAAEFTRITDNEVIPLLRKQKGFRYETTLIAPEPYWVSAGVEDPYERN
jgi:hypothetical protein